MHNKNKSNVQGQSYSQEYAIGSSQSRPMSEKEPEQGLEEHRWWPMIKGLFSKPGSRVKVAKSSVASGTSGAE